jgi:hypothetical protein
MNSASQQHVVLKSRAMSIMAACGSFGLSHVIMISLILVPSPMPA